MKKIILSAVLVSSIFASENYFEIGGGFVNFKDNFSTESKENISSLNSTQTEDTTIPYLEFFYGHNLNEKIKLYVSSQLGEFNLGSQINSNYGYFDFGLKTDFISQEWKNPYLTGAKREKTDVKEFGAYIGYGVSFTKTHEGMIKYEYSNKEYDNDLLTGDMKRDGNKHKFSFENMYYSSLFGKENAYLTNLNLENFKADGEANSYTKYELEVGTSTSLNDSLRLTLLANLGEQDYDKHNTAVNQKVNVKLYGAKAILNWDKPFGYKNTYASLKTGYEKEEANADFFDKENTFGIVSVGYRF